MLNITEVNLSVTNLVSINEDSIINKTGSNEVVKAKFGAKTAKTKSKNSAQFQLTAQSSRAGFFIPKAKLAFNKLRQAFTQAPILHHFDLDCYI